VRVVEFLGPPGAGKSSLLREIVGSLRATGSSASDLDTAALTAIRHNGKDSLAKAVAGIARSGSNPIWRRAYARSTDRFSALTRFATANPQVLEAVLAAQRLRRDRDLHQGQTLSWVLNLMARIQLSHEAAEPSDWLLIDEGFCQRAIAIFGLGFNGEDQDLLRSYIATIPLPRFVIAVETPVSVCEARLDEGSWSERVQRLTGDERRAFLATAAGLAKIIAYEAEERGALVIRVDGTAPLAANRDVLQMYASDD
jgi:hypothetical protein